MVSVTSNQNLMAGLPFHRFTAKLNESDLVKLGRDLTELRRGDPECCLKKPGGPTSISKPPSSGQPKVMSEVYASICCPQDTYAEKDQRN